MQQLPKSRGRIDEVAVEGDGDVHGGGDDGELRATISREDVADIYNISYQTDS